MQIAKEALQNDDSNEEGLTEEDLKVQTVLKQSLSVRRLAGPSVRTSVRLFCIVQSVKYEYIDYLGRVKFCRVENCTKIVCLFICLYIHMFFRPSSTIYLTTMLY